MHTAKLASMGISYLGDLQLDDLCQLQEELDSLWKNGQSTISNTLYDKVVDGINYEMIQLTNDPYDFVVKKNDSQLKKIVVYLTQLNAQGKPLFDKSISDILNQELALRNVLIPDPTTTFPQHWTSVSMIESPVTLISLSRSSQEFEDISNFFTKSLQKSSVVIYSIVRIQNIRLWCMYQQVQKAISSISTRLIHGTASLAHQKLITYHGFYRSYCPGGLIGDGVYFAVHANYSNNDPFVMKKTSHRRELFICQVLLGQSIAGRSGFKSLPYGYDSAFNHAGDRNDQFCIFNPYQAYPEYIVQYDYE
ncbi:unnamed protein product [Adineta steineri]|uniref:Poly [ADP-ribose] polymerase n=2 Tax=Adineta steineri TaxID=433720 RepID=A0A818QQW8_9BILA|nr:unnamed protein product [Adineta steineri]